MMAAEFKKFMWKSALAVLSLAAVTPNLSAGVAISITENAATETFSVSDPYSVIASQYIGPVGSSSHQIVIELKPGFNLPNKDYSFPEPDNKGINYVAFRPIYSDTFGRVNPAKLYIFSDVTEDPAYSVYFALKKYNNDVHIFNSSTGVTVDWGNITFGYSAVPEPSTYLAGLSALGMLGLFGWRSRK